MDTAYSQTLSASGAAPVTWTLVSGTLPDGLSLNTVAGTISGAPATIGVISGTPAAEGTSSITVQAANDEGSAAREFSIEICENTAATVSAILNNLQALISAADMFYAYADHLSFEAPALEDLKPYLRDPSIFDSGFCVEEGDDDYDGWWWWIGFNLEGKSSRVKDALKSRGAELGLHGGKNVNEPYADQDIVWMCIHTGTTTWSGRASTIVNDLRELASAAIMFYADHLDGKPTTIKDLMRYVNDSSKFESGFYVKCDDKGWWVGCNVEGERSAVKGRLKDRAAEGGLYGAADSSVPYTDQDIVWMKAR
jgi:hypothetical protein